MIPDIAISEVAPKASITTIIIKVMPWVGAALGVIGAILLAFNFELSKYGYVFFLLSSVSLSVWAITDKQYHQLMMQLVFTVINTIGLYKWVLV